MRKRKTGGNQATGHPQATVSWAYRKIPLIILITIIGFALGLVVIDRGTGVSLPYYSGNNATYDFRCSSEDFFHELDGTESTFMVKAVTVTPGDASDYEGWMNVFDLVEGLNANTVQADDIMPPSFYQALHDRNHSGQSDANLYILQRVKLGDDSYSSMTDVYSSDVCGKLLKKGKLAIDAVHGRRNISGYFWDVSEYVVGFEVGDDWDPKLIAYSADLKEGTTYEYTGQYFGCTSSFTFFEAQLAEVMNDLCSYETHKYDSQTPIGLWNWTYTDQIVRTYGFIETYDSIASVYQSVIVANKENRAGTFASYNICDMTDLLITTDKDYSSYLNEDGDIDPTEAYVKDLVNSASGPLVISSFAVSSSRGISGIDTDLDIQLGGLSEKEQGRAIADMIESIIRAGSSGCCVSLYDDLKATTWNTDDVSDANGLWQNFQSSHGSLGLITYESDVCCVDGNDSEWTDTEPLISSDGAELKMAYDETYLYFAATVPNLDVNRTSFYIPLDITPLSGARALDSKLTFDPVLADREESDAETMDSKLTFDRDMDFVICIDGVDGSAVLVHRYYDYLYATAGSDLYGVDTTVDKPKKDTTIFDVIYQCASPSLTGSDGFQIKEFPATSLPTGSLAYGTADPDSANYYSLADFCFGRDTVEIRIPWALLNFYDPASSTILGDLFDGSKTGKIAIEDIYASLIVDDAGTRTDYASVRFDLPGWTEFAQTTRLKDSYDLVARAYLRLADIS